MDDSQALGKVYSYNTLVNFVQSDYSNKGYDVNTGMVFQVDDPIDKESKYKGISIVAIKKQCETLDVVLVECRGDMPSSMLTKDSKELRLNMITQYLKKRNPQANISKVYAYWDEKNEPRYQQLD